MREHATHDFVRNRQEYVEEWQLDANGLWLAQQAEKAVSGAEMKDAFILKSALDEIAQQGVRAKFKQPYNQCDREPKNGN